MSTMSIEVVLRLIDEMTAPLRTAQRELNTLGKSTAGAGASTGKLVAPWEAEAKAINQANAALIRHQAKPGISAKLSQPWTAPLRTAQGELNTLGQSTAGAGAATGKLVAPWQAKAGAIAKANKALADHGASISAKFTQPWANSLTGIGSGLDVFHKKLPGLEKQTSAMATEWARIATSISEAASALKGMKIPAVRAGDARPGQASKGDGQSVLGGGLVGGMLGFEGLHAGRQLVHGTIHAGAEAAHQEVNMQTAGMTDLERSQIKAKAFELSTTTNRNFSQTSIEQTAQDMRSVLGSERVNDFETAGFAI